MAACVAEDVALRRSLPATYLDAVGAAHSDLPLRAAAARASAGANDDGDDSDSGDDGDNDNNDDDDNGDDDDDDDDDESGSTGGAGPAATGAAVRRRAAGRATFLAQLRGHLDGVVEQCMELADSAADQMAKRYLSDRLPPPLTDAEEARTNEGLPNAEATLRRLLLGAARAGAGQASESAKKKPRHEDDGGGGGGSGSGGGGGDPRLRMVRAGVARVVVEDGVAVVYHCMDNARWHHGAPLQSLEFPLDDAPAIEALLAAYPDPIRVADLPHAASSEDLETKVDIAIALFKEGFLVLVED